MEEIQLEITEQDIQNANPLRFAAKSHFEQFTPACVAMGRITGSKWHTVGTVMLVENHTPFRFCVMPLALNEKLDRFLLDGEMESCCFVVTIEQLKPPPLRRLHMNE